MLAETMKEVDAAAWLNQIPRELLVKQRTERHQADPVPLVSISRASPSRELGAFL
jgi:hypothetical protein